MANATVGGLTRVRINNVDIVPTSFQTTDGLTWEESEGVVGIGTNGQVCNFKCLR